MKVSAARKQTFVEALVRGQTPETAAKAIGVSRATAYRWRDTDAVFAADWEDARERKIEAVENVLYRMAIEKDLGAICFFLKAHKPEVYNRRQVIALGGDLDNPLVVHQTGRGGTVHFYMPPNHRDQPEEIESDEPPTIEGEVDAA